MRKYDLKQFAYNEITDEWASFIDRYDTDRRIEVLVHEFLGSDLIRGRSCLDGGCGLGFFSLELQRCGGKVVALDIGVDLVSRLKSANPKIEAVVGDLCSLGDSLDSRRFEIVVSSEAIEHTRHPRTALENLCERVAPGGYLAISCPNQRWRWLLSLAQCLHVRKNYKGYENWVRPSDLHEWVKGAGLEVVRAEGIHFLPWQLLPKSIIRRLDRLTRGWNYGWAINLALLARRP